jgi:ribosome maturation factor RimP
MPNTTPLSPTIEAALREICTQHGVVLVEVVIRGSNERRIVEIYVDKPEGISLDECGNLSEPIGTMLEETKAFPMAYRLEISSPGVSRPLQFSWQYERNIGRLLTLERITGGTVKGRISAVASDTERGDLLTLDAPKGTISKTAAKKAAESGIVFPIEILLGEIKSAIVEVEF